MKRRGKGEEKGEGRREWGREKRRGKGEEKGDGRREGGREKRRGREGEGIGEVERRGREKRERGGGGAKENGPPLILGERCSLSSSPSPSSNIGQ